MNKRFYLILCTGICSFSASGAENPQANRVRHDPFQRPALPQSSITAPEAEKPTAQQPWAPKLSGTLRAGRNSMANVNGNIVKLGETIDGYKLIEVDERSAIFVKNKQSTHLTIDAEPIE